MKSCARTKTVIILAGVAMLSLPLPARAGGEHHVHGPPLSLQSEGLFADAGATYRALRGSEPPAGVDLSALQESIDLMNAEWAQLEDRHLRTIEAESAARLAEGKTRTLAKGDVLTISQGASATRMVWVDGVRHVVELWRDEVPVLGVLEAEMDAFASAARAALEAVVTDLDPTTTGPGRGLVDTEPLTPAGGMVGATDCLCEPWTFSTLGDPPPACVGSWGVTTTLSRWGICNYEEVCDVPESPCFMKLTLQATSAPGQQCDWHITNLPAVDYEDDEDASISVTFEKSCKVDSAGATFVHFAANGVDLGHLQVGCSDCAADGTVIPPPGTRQGIGEF